MTEKMKIAPRDKEFLKLLLRSPDVGDGWRNVSSAVWPLVAAFKHPELIRMRNGNQVKLSGRGLIIVDYI